ncbi:MAG: beta-lactamase family protein [Gammaproteobacteria bacterium]|nr:beta-lactamase family protein [Gammaproteobacteria bacterium]
MQKLNLLLCTIIFSFTASAFAKNDLGSTVDSFIHNFEKEKNSISGGAIAVIYKGHVIYKNTFGHEKDSNSPKITSRTLFPLASVSKPVSATAVALLVANGVLNLDEKYNLPYLQNPVNIKNILGHTTGYKFSGNIEIEHGDKRDKILKLLKVQSPTCQPGECYSYSNTTFSLIEEALNTKNLDLQLAIKNLRIALNTDGIQVVPLPANMRVAYPHIVTNNRFSFFRRVLPFPKYYPKAAPAAAGVFASLDGMIEIFKFNFGYRPDLISKEILTLFHTPLSFNRDIARWHTKWPIPIRKIESYYGVGWRILKPKPYPDKNLIFHSGTISGIKTFIGFIPAEEIGIIVLTNENSNFCFKTGISFWGKFLNKQIVSNT